MAEKTYYLPGRINTWDLPFGIGGRQVTADEYKRITGKYPTGYQAPSSEPAGGMSAAELKAAQDAANKERRQGRMSDLRGGPVKVEQPKVEQPKVDQTQPQAQVPKPSGPSLRDIAAEVRAARMRSIERQGGRPDEVSKLRSTLSSKQADASDVRKAELEKVRQQSMARTMKREAYDVVLDYLLSEGHADTVEEAHYVMMQLDSEYVQSIVEAGLPIPPGGIKPDRLNPIDPATGKSMYKVVPGASGKPKEIRNPSFGKLPPA